MTVRTHRLAAAAVAALATMGAGVVTATAASAATAEMPITCGGQTLTIRVPQSHEDNWGAAQVVDGGHLVLKSLEFTVYDVTAGVLLDHEVESHGQAHANQDTIHCVIDSSTGVIGDPPEGFVWPAGTGPEDIGAFTVAVEVVPFS
jgi:hypothetical protein